MGMRDLVVAAVLRASSFLGALLIAAAVSAQQPVNSPARTPSLPNPVGTGRLGGHVRGSTGAPLRQTIVSAIPSPAGPPRTVTTDADGRYEITDLPAGRYIVSASTPLFVTLAYGQTRPRDLSTAIDLNDGQVVNNIDITLPAAGVIAGRVLNDYGEPVLDARVVAMQRRVQQGQWRLSAVGRVATTNDLGEFRVFGLAPGQYYVCVSGAPGTAAPLAVPRNHAGYAPTYYPGGSDVAAAQPVVVGLSETIGGLAITLVPERLATVTGSASDFQGQPIRRGTVTALAREGNVTGHLPEAPLKPDGTFALSDMPPGEFVLRAMVSIAVPALANQLQPTATVITQATGTVRVNGRDLFGVQLKPTKTVTISGRVVPDAQSSAPLRPDMIQLTPAVRSVEVTASREPRPVVNPDFSFQFSVPAAEIALRAVVTASDRVVKAIRVRGADITDRGVDLREGRDVDGFEIELTTQPSQVSGVVTGARGEPLSGCTVLYFPEDAGRWFLDSRLLGLVRSNGQGAFKVRTLPPGRYLAVAFEGIPPESYQDADFLESLRPRATRFSLVEGGTSTIDLKVGTGR